MAFYAPPDGGVVPLMHNLLTRILKNILKLTILASIFAGIEAVVALWRLFFRARGRRARKESLQRAKTASNPANTDAKTVNFEIVLNNLVRRL